MSTLEVPALPLHCVKQNKERQAHRSQSSKDLVVRMLAEVFKVGQGSEGELRWLQVSNSLVPISLYSRTTSHWLNYLLAASSASAAASTTMSPDSRDFLLLLLDQFRYNQDHQATQAHNHQQILFQVLAHDFCQGNCRKIMNVKIVQPGTRLGRASDYFVYWKSDQIPVSNNNSLLNSHQRQHHHAQNLQSSSLSFTSSTSNCCQIAPIRNSSHPDNLNVPTWGLNFASVNDAKLFFDICSLNSIDLNFNSDYLKKVASTRRNHLPVLKDQQCFTSYEINSQPYPIDRGSQIPSGRERQFNICTNTRNFQNQLAGKSPCSERAGSNDYIKFNVNDRNFCPIHRVNYKDRLQPATNQQQTTSNVRQLRTRSRSTTRQPNTNTLSTSKLNLERLRSFSTPPSPNYQQQQQQQQCYNCHFHNKQAGNMVESSIDSERNEFNHLQCLGSMDLAYRESLKANSKQFQKPKKPVRGEFRDPLSLQSIDVNENKLAQDQFIGHSRQSVQTNRCNSKSEVLEPKSLSIESEKYPDTLNQSSARQKGKDLFCQVQKISRLNQDSDEQQAATGFAVGKHSQRRYTGIALDNIQQFNNSLAHNARLARAQYANSKNMKEFLSLDAAGLQLTPTQLLSLNSRIPKQTNFLEDSLNTKTDINTGDKVDTLEIKSGSTKRPAVSFINKRKPNFSLSDQISSFKTGKIKSECPTAPFFSEKPDELVEATVGSEATKIISGETIEKNHDSLENLNVMRNVSTTTDDLPLDPTTKRRMFVLSNEEIENDQKEPESLAADYLLEKHLQLNNGCYFDEKKDPQIQVASNCPVNLNSRNIHESTRSETSRRRSLERRTCIDMDSTLSRNQYVKKYYCLSDLPQSTSPIANYSSKRSPGNEGPSIIKEKRDVLRKSTPKKRLRTKSTGETEFESYLTSKPPSMLKMNRDSAYLSTSCQGRSSHMPNSKSAPDVTQLDTHQFNTKSRGHSTNTNSDLRCTKCIHRHGVAIPLDSIEQTFSKSNHPTGISSYAIPLYSKEKEDLEGQSSYAPHSLSCPNSLRRKRSKLHSHDEMQKNNSHYNSSLTHIIACTCQQCSSRTKQIPIRLSRCENAIVNNCSFCSKNSEVDATKCDQLNLNSSVDNLMRRHQYGLDCSNNSVAVGLKLQDSKSTTCGMHSCTHTSTSSYRPFTSQSSTILLHHGAYGSEHEDDSPTCSKLQFSPDSNQCFEGSNAFHRTSSVYLCPTLKPVSGYDQTLARSSLKLRQRAKSQPPESVTDEIFHLNKSMENVRKLITEVQKELDFVIGKPLSFGCLNQATKKLSEIDSSNLIENDGERVSILGPDKKMSNDESNQQIERKLSENKGEWLSLNDSTTSCAAQIKCVGAIRKAGFLSVKKWILKRRQSIELARKQGWKRYWVCLRGTALLFYSVIDKKESLCSTETNHQTQKYTDLLSWIRANCPGNLLTMAGLLQIVSSKDVNQSSGNDKFMQNISQCYIEEEPRHLIVIDSSIAQPIPEHPKRDFVFCLSTTFGDAYLFQSSCQLESDNWISAIHNACAASIARDLTREEATKLFETRIRNLELEAEKKLFLRQRLESRLTSMTSVSHISSLIAPTVAEVTNQLDDSKENEETRVKKNTMRSLLYRLSQQLSALDRYSEQVYCEIYQLRCYLSSCESQRFFYQNIQNLNQNSSSNTQTAFTRMDLPHPKSLLMHVSKSTKLTLIKLGVFTVSSFHAYVHSRQGSAESILRKIQLANSNQSPLKYKISSSQSISAKFSGKAINSELDNDTEQLIHLTNLKVVPVRLTRRLLNRIRNLDDENEDAFSSLNDSDDQYSIQVESNFVIINLKLHLNSSSISLIKKVLKIVEPSTNELDFLKYYIQFKPLKINESPYNEESEKESLHYVPKRHETLAEWTNFKFLELKEKIVFKVKLERKRFDEEAIPFGISIGAQLFTGEQENELNVYCSYIEWGSVADRAGLKDDDELLMINGIPVVDLDMMFIECIIQDETDLNLVVRSSKSESPADSLLLDKSTWRPFDNDKDPHFTQDENNTKNINSAAFNQDISTFGSQIISDEYISSLVCPPPPSNSSSLYRMNSILVRHKSDLGADIGEQNAAESNDVEKKLKLVSSATNQLSNKVQQEITKAKSHQNLDYLNEDEIGQLISSVKNNQANRHSQFSCHQVISSVDLADQLLKKTERLTRLLGKNSWLECEKDVKEKGQLDLMTNLNSSEKLKKSLTELLETEYAYIRHLEIIIEHYMNPLEETSYLNIPALKDLSQIIADILTFQCQFFDKLINSILEKYKWSETLRLDDEYGKHNKIVQQLDLFHSVNDYEPLLESLSSTFTSEADNFKIYSKYCVAYSKLQKFLHPKQVLGSNSSLISISSTPATLDTFLISNTLSLLPNNIGGNVTQQRDFLKPLGSLLTSSKDFAIQLKHLNDFLGNLDSSSSSASLSLPKSSVSSDATQSVSKKSSKSSSVPTFQKSVHQQNFESYLIKPIQRIVKYPLLLNSIANSAQQCSEQIHTNLQEAVSHMSSITAYVNDTQRVHDEYGSSFDIIEKQFIEQQNYLLKKHSISYLSVHQPPISLKVESLLFFGFVDWLNINEFAPKLKKDAILSQMLFVFTSCVVLICKEQVKSTKKRLPISGSIANLSLSKVAASQKTLVEHHADIIRYQTLIPVKEVQVRSVPLPNIESQSKSRYLWELFRCSSVNSNSNLLTKASKRNTSGKVYLLANSDNETRNAFLRKIRFIIRESVRNMSLPTVRSPSRKSSTPKKVLIETNSNSSCSHSTSLSPDCSRGESIQKIKDDVDCNFNVVKSSYKTSIEVKN